MQITCDCGSSSGKFLLPLWVRCTFKIGDDGNLSVLHVRELESLTEKIADQNRLPSLTCQECGSEAKITYNEYARLDQEKRQMEALRGL